MFNQDKNDKAGTGANHGSIASPLEPCKHDIAPGQASNNMLPPFDAPAPSSSLLPPTQFTTTVDQNKKGGAIFETPMDGATSIGAEGQASGTGNKDKSNVSSPWSGPFGSL